MWSKDRWQEIFYTLRKNKLRTTLSGFTVALGIFIFVVLFGFGNGLKNSFEAFLSTIQLIPFGFMLEKQKSPTEDIKPIDALFLKMTT